MRTHLIITSIFMLHTTAWAQCDITDTFETEIRLDMPPSPWDVKFADFDNDGHQDIAASASPAANGAGVRIYHNDGKGNFASFTDLAASDRLYAITCGDINGDGFTDIVTVARFAGYVGVYINAGGQGFLPEVVYPSPGVPSFGLVISDFNLDGFQDIAYTDNQLDRVSVLFNNTLGEFTSQENFPVGENPRGMKLADLNQDGIDDLLVVNGVSDDMSILYGSSQHVLSPEIRFPTGDNPYAFDLTDLNKDGLLDLAVSCQDDATVVVHLGDSNGGFGAPSIVAHDVNVQAIYFGDIDLNGIVDMALLNQSPETITIDLGDDGLFSGPTAEYEVGISPQNLAIADLSGDSDLDFVVCNIGSSDLSLLINQCTPPEPCIPDLDEDGDLDFFDISAFLAFYQLGNLTVDFTGDGSLDFFDVSVFLNEYIAGCP